jgi:hypothetical protein
MKASFVTALFVMTMASTGCSFHARDAEGYRKDTRTLLESKNADIKSCYDAALVKNPSVSGNVIVHFTVQSETGTVKDAKVDPSSSAPADLSQCVVNAIQGLTLDPPDARDGDATYSWEFQVRS